MVVKLTHPARRLASKPLPADKYFNSPWTTLDPTSGFSFEQLEQAVVDYGLPRRLVCWALDPSTTPLACLGASQLYFLALARGRLTGLVAPLTGVVRAGLYFGGCLLYPRTDIEVNPNALFTQKK